MLNTDNVPLLLQGISKKKAYKKKMRKGEIKNVSDINIDKGRNFGADSIWLQSNFVLLAK